MRPVSFFLVSLYYDMLTCFSNYISFHLLLQNQVRNFNDEKKEKHNDIWQLFKEAQQSKLPSYPIRITLSELYEDLI